MPHWASFLLILAVVLVVFGIPTYFAARDPLNRKDNPDGYKDADEWRL